MRRAMNIVPGRGTRVLLAMLPFALLACVYVLGSAERRAANPDDKLLPPFSQMARDHDPHGDRAGQAHRLDRAVGRHQPPACSGSASGSASPRSPAWCSASRSAYCRWYEAPSRRWSR